jgi:hypothetical protein
MIGCRTATRIVLGSALVAGWIGTAQATPTAQQNCDYARVTAWKVYQSCVDTAVAKVAKGVSFDYIAAFARCRHTYFKKWTAFQPKTSLAGSSCVSASRFTSTDSGTTETDNLTGLVWEKKTNKNGTQNSGDPHDADNYYTWGTGSSPYYGNGTAFATFLTGATTGLNVAGFAGAKDWRLPTVAELQTIVLDFACTGAFGGGTCSCPSTPCVDPALDATNTQSNFYWSATTGAGNPFTAWVVDFSDGFVGSGSKTFSGYVRAVRSGL